jgi:branched-subunit amino acid ABC-type transport system permease component
MQQFFQLAVDGVIIGSAYAVIGIAFGLILGVTGRFHFAFAITYTLAAYVATSIVSHVDHTNTARAVLAIAAGLAAAVALGVLIEVVVYRPLTVGQPTLALLAVFVSALGLTIAGENVIRLIWGSSSQVLTTTLTGEGHTIGEVTFTTFDIVYVAVLWLLVLLTWGFLTFTAHGRAVVAVRVNPEMAAVVGINPARVFSLVFALGSFLGGAAAILFTIRLAASAEMGLLPTFNALVVAFVAGLASGPLRFALFGLGLGLAENISRLWLSVQWSPVVLFSALFLYVALGPVLAAGRIRFAQRKLLQPEAV